jgi:predicted esterase
MKRHTWQAFVSLLIATLVSCSQAAAEPTEGMINPGDEIDGMVFTTVDEIDWDFSLAMLCDQESVEKTDTTVKLACFTSPGGTVFFGNCTGVVYDSPEEADELWQEFRLTVTFDDHVINLAPFGNLDFDLDGADKKHARIWNLVVENITPGTHSVECVDKMEEVTETRTYVFTVSEQSDTYSTLSAGAPTRIHPYTSEKANLNYLLYLPGEYGVDPQRQWPLLLYLHGLDRANTSVAVLQNDYPLSGLANQDFFPFIVVAPKASGEYEIWAKDEMVSAIMTLLDEIEATLSVDPARVYLTGVSAGGNGTWTIGLRHPERFAALVPAMGYYGWPFTVPENICDLADMPIRAFHGDQDEVVPLEAEQTLVDALQACGGDVQMTVFPDTGHDLASERIYTADLYTWLLEQMIR